MSRWGKRRSRQSTPLRRLFALVLRASGKARPCGSCWSQRDRRLGEGQLMDAIVRRPDRTLVARPHTCMSAPSTPARSAYPQPAPREERLAATTVTQVRPNSLWGLAASPPHRGPRCVAQPGSKNPITVRARGGQLSHPSPPVVQPSDLLDTDSGRQEPRPTCRLEEVGA